STVPGDRALGGVASGSTTTMYWAVRLVNNTGTTLTSIDVSFYGEQWRDANTTAQTMPFDYQVADAGIITAANTPSTGWTAVSALTFTSPTNANSGALDGNDSANRTLESANIPMSVAPGQEIWLRWTDTNDAGSDHGLAVDDLVVVANGSGGGGNLTLSIDNVSHNEGNSGPTNFDFTVTLSAPAPAGGVTFDIATADDSATVADSDYTPRALSGQSIAAGNTTYLFTVQVTGDSTAEPDELFHVNVSNISGTGVTTTSAQGTGTIVNDDVPVLTIGAIQGDGDASPHVNQTLTTTGSSVVTALTNNGFYMQDPIANSDHNPDTSDAIYVYTGGAPVYTGGSTPIATGDVVAVTGSISEFNGTTEFNSGSTVTFVSSSSSIAPTLLTLALPSPDPTLHHCQGSLDPNNAHAVGEANWECLESMLMQLDGVVVGATGGGFAADGTHPGTPGSFHATVNNAPRPFREPGIAYPANVTGYTGPIWDGDPEIIEVYTKTSLVGAPSIVPVYDAGQQFTTTAIVSDYNGSYELYPLMFSTVGATPNTVQPVPDSAIGTLTIASQNMLHLFNDVDDSGNADDCTAGSKDSCPDAAQFAIRLSKLSLQVRTVLKAPAVIGVQEVENLDTLQSLADKIHSDDANLAYTPYLIEGNDIGGIDVGFLVRNDVTVNAVTQIGNATTTDDGCGGSASSCKLNDRPPLLLDASFNGKRFAVLVIHNRSLNGVDDTPRVRRKRLEQAQYVAAIVQAWQTGTGSDVALVSPDAHITLGASGETVPAADGTAPIVVVGDYNAYEFTDGYTDVTGQIKGTAEQSDNVEWAAPITTPTLCDAGLTTDASTRYSFAFDGYVQELDHALLTRVAWKDFVSLHNAHGNADTSEAGAAVTDPNTAARSADHDGQVLTLTVDRLFADDFEGDTCR
ncbi:MAG TPA: hypothetical protein VFN13_07250, partial [Rudaea sp.]|nr:hypothetical protein [Rudaea sp.]